MGIANFCERMHCLPEPGGYFDQDSFLIWGISLVVGAKIAKEAEDNHRAQKQERR